MCLITNEKSKIELQEKMLRTTLIILTLVLGVLTMVPPSNDLPVVPALTNCGIYTISKPCGNPCEEICGQPKPEYCPKVCIVDGCVCIPGYIRRDQNGPCVPLKWCKLVAEEWTWTEMVRPFN